MTGVQTCALPICNKEHVNRNLGDIFGVGLAAKYRFTDAFSGSVTYNFLKKAKDNISGDMGFAYDSLQDETEREEQVAMVGITYSTISQYRAKQFPVPMEATLTYRNRFDGSDNALKSEYIGLWLAAYY